jgi:hypothetical protein
VEKATARPRQSEGRKRLRWRRVKKAPTKAAKLAAVAGASQGRENGFA